MWKITVDYAGWQSTYYTSIGAHGCDALSAVQEHMLADGMPHMHVFNLFVRGWIEDAIKLGSWFIEREDTVVHSHTVQISPSSPEHK